MSDNPMIYAVRKGLMLSIPLLMIGSFALVFKFLPIPWYQDFIYHFASGRLVDMFTLINQVTFGMLSIGIVLCISYCYSELNTKKDGVIFGAIISALCAYLIFIAFLTDHFDIRSFGAHGMFSAIFSATVFSAVYFKLYRLKIFTARFYTLGADSDFNAILAACVPVGATILLALLLNRLINFTFGVVGLEALFHKCMHILFSGIKSNALGILFYVILSSLLWFLGIHGTNALFTVEDLVFAQQSGIITKNFIDVFVLMGGCGATISLLVAILLFSRQHNTKSLAKYACIPMLFNINEMMVYGLPIVLNSAFFLPFILTPLVCFLIAFLALSSGLVPLPLNKVNWVMPVIINGYQATGSVLGSLLQIVNIAAGAAVYRWFLLRYEEKSKQQAKEDYEKLLVLYKKAEKQSNEFRLRELPGRLGGIVRLLSSDLEYVIKTGKALTLFYQPQFNSEGRCIGAEALLRWNHPRFGLIYPPLLISLARELKILNQLERQIFELAFQDMETLAASGAALQKVSINATPASLKQQSFVDFIRKAFGAHPALKGKLCIELTEQMSFGLTNENEDLLRQLKDMGISLAIDDFSMGHTSIKYLQSNLFSLVKLDGSLIQDLPVNERSAEIVTSIVNMSTSMGFEVLAEFVETDAIRDMLKDLGVHLYQGYLYSKAIPLEELILKLGRSA